MYESLYLYLHSETIPNYNIYYIIVQIQHVYWVYDYT